MHCARVIILYEYASRLSECAPTHSDRVLPLPERVLAPHKNALDVHKNAQTVREGNFEFHESASRHSETELRLHENAQTLRENE
jgi:hypothetical protein